MWHPTVIDNGKITAQSVPKICQPDGTIPVARMIMAALTAMQITRASQKRFAILGTSSQKFDRSTSFLVAPQLML